MDPLSAIVAVLCGVLAYHAHITAKRLRADIDGYKVTIAALTAAVQALEGEAIATAKRLQAVDRDTQALCSQAGVKRYGEGR